MTSPESIPHFCVFCSASDAVADEYKALARDLGHIFADHGWCMVYGGGSGGLMGAAASAALDRGAPVTGVIPGFLVEKEIAHPGLTTLHTVETMHQRQFKMAELSHGFIVLPGGLGTLAEFSEIVTWKLLGHHGKPIVIVNYNQYWDNLLHLVDAMTKQHFLREEPADLYRVVDNIEKIPQIFKTF